MGEISINNVSELLDILNVIKFNFGIDNRIKKLFMYRGHASVEYKLIPSIFRKYKKENDKKEYYKYFLLDENEMYMHFIKEAKSYIKNIDDNTNEGYLEWLVYAQHFGVPTRLLDFTHNPLVALYFACSKEEKEDGAIWIINLINYRKIHSKVLKSEPNVNQYTTINELIYKIISELKNETFNCSNFPIHFIPYYFDERMSVQASSFLLWGKDERPFEDMIEKENYIDISSAKNGVSIEYEGKSEEFILKILIPHEKKKSILEELDLLGVNSKSIFPGLDGIGKYIENYYNVEGKLFLS